MTDPKPSTDDILSKIRAKAAAPASPPAAAPASSEPAAEASSEKPAAAAPQSTADILAAARAKAAPAKPAAAPGGTADILSAIKSQAKPAAAAPAGAAPKSPADIMAAIRGGAGAAKPAAPAAAKPAAEAPKPAVATAGMSAAEMIKAARVGESGTAAAPPRVALPTKPLPGKVAAKAAVPEETRRGFLSTATSAILSPVVIAWTSFVGSLLASSLAVARFMMPNVLVEPPTRFKIGPPNDYAPGTVSTKWQAQFGIWVVNAEVDGAAVIYALSTVCTHLGCTPNWLEGEQKFKCPCHGSGFYKTGVNFEGPAPRPLERYGLRLAEDGMLEVDKSLKFQKELGQWSNPACFVPVA